MTRRLIRTDGTEQEIDMMTSREICKLIGAQCLDTVSLRHLGEPLQIMIVDDHGFDVEIVERAPGHVELRPVKARKPINREATRLYRLNCRPGATHQIAGDVVVVPDSDFA